MNRSQLVFGALFDSQFFGPRNGFEFRDWQSECGDDYSANVLRFQDSFGVEIQHRYTLVGGTGSGKTKAVAGLAAWLLNGRLVDQVVFVCPNRSIRRKTQKDFRQFFNIHLTVFYKSRHKEGIPRDIQGYILTYAALMNDPTLHRRICSRTATLVIFDEIHHLGDESAWGDSATEAFSKVPFVIGLSGTPYRSDNRRIPFVTYEEKAGDDGVLCFKANSPYGYTYNLGRAVDDGVCRKPLFLFSRGTVRIRLGLDAGFREVTFEDIEVSPDISALRLKGAVKFGSVTRRQLLTEALQQCREERRKVIIYLGGDTESDQTPTEDAKAFLPQDLEALGITATEYEVITGDDTEAVAKIESFGASDKWIIAAINMVSEGVDIPELSAAIFLTSVTAKQTTVQRIGRVLRRMGDDDPHPDALIFMFADPSHMKITEEIETIIAHEIDLGRRRRIEGGELGAGNGKPPHVRAEAIGISGGEIMMAKVRDIEVPMSVIDEARADLKRQGLPATMLHAYLLVTTRR